MILTRVYPLVLLAALAGWAALLPFALARFRRRLTASAAVALAALVLASLAWRLAQPAAHRVFDDEFEHLDASRRVSEEGIYGVTTAGGLGDWSVYAAPTWPAGHHAALAAWMKAAGTDAAAARAWSALLGALTVLLIFWAALEIFGEEGPALAAASAWAALPLAVRYAAASELTTPSLFWVAASLACLHAREKETSKWFDAFTAVTLAYAVQVRPENAVLILYALAVCSRRSLIIPCVVSALVPLTIAWSNRASGVAGYAVQDFSPLTHFFRQSCSNVSFLAAVPVAWAAAISVFRRPLKAAPLWALSAVLFVVYTSFFRGEFARGAEDRYALFVLLPLTIAAAGALAVSARAAAALFIGFGLVAPKPAEPVEHERARAHLEESSRRLAPGTPILGFNPSKLRVVTGHPAASVYFALEDFQALAGEKPALAVWKDWGWRTRPAAGSRLEGLLSKDYDRVATFDDGADALVVWRRR